MPRSTARRRRSRDASSSAGACGRAGYGGSQTTDGNAALGSNNTRPAASTASRSAPTIASRRTRWPALRSPAAAPISASPTVSARGRSDLFQAGAFVRHNVGAGLSHRRAGLWLAGRHHRSHRHRRRHRPAARAVQRQRLLGPRRRRLSLRRAMDRRLASRPMPPGSSPPSICRPMPSRRSPAPTRLRWPTASKSVTDTRSELGLRTDKSFAMQDGDLHPARPRRLGARFQSRPRYRRDLPDAARRVLRRQRRARRRATPRSSPASAEMKWLNGFSLAATFEGEFSNVTRSWMGRR